MAKGKLVGVRILYIVVAAAVGGSFYISIIYCLTVVGIRSSLYKVTATFGYKYQTLYPNYEDSSFNYLRHSTDIHQQDLSHRINTYTITLLYYATLEDRRRRLQHVVNRDFCVQKVDYVLRP